MLPLFTPGKALLVASVLALTACSPTYYLSMQPSTGSGEWRNGYEQVVARQDSVLLKLNFVRYEPNSLVFELDIQNESDKPLLVAPEQFSYQPVATTLHEGEQYLPYFKTAVTAVNPEQKIGQLNNALAYNLKEANRLMLLASPEYANQTRLLHTQVAAQVREQKNELEGQILRKNTLAPGQGIRGWVFFPRTDAADVMRLTLPLGGQPLVLDYKQLRSRTATY